MRQPDTQRLTFRQPQPCQPPHSRVYQIARKIPPFIAFSIGVAVLALAAIGAYALITGAVP